MADAMLRGYTEMLDTDYDGQNVLIKDDLALRNQIREELTREDIDWEEQADLPKDPYEEALLRERPERRRLKRDLEREALLRLEEAAKTSADFHYIVSWWNRLDANRERRERYHEILRSGDGLPLESGEADDGAVFPSSLHPVLARQLRRGDFLDTIHYCPYEVQELVADDYVYSALGSLPDDRKQLLFLRAVEYMSSARIAQIRGQSDRNVRKIWATLKKKLRKSCANDLSARKGRGQALTGAENAFLKEYMEKGA